MADKPTNDDIKWLKSLPDTAFIGWSGTKHKVMERLGIPGGEFTRWIMPYYWIVACKKEGQRRMK